MAWAFPLDVVLVVTDVVSSPMPPDSSLSRGSLGVDQRLHSSVVKGIWLQKVDDVKFVFPPGPYVAKAEIIPVERSRIKRESYRENRPKKEAVKRII